MNSGLQEPQSVHGVEQLNLLTVADAENLTIDQVWDYYRKHINASQVELLGAFGPGRDLVDYSEGCYIYLKSGRRILDLTGGIGVLNHGHNHPAILATRRDFETRKRMEVHKNYLSPYTAALSANLAKILPGDLDVSYFPNSGAEAVEGAVKMAYKFHNGQRQQIRHSDISFHGKLLGAAGLTGSPELHFDFPSIPGVGTFEYNNLDSVRSAVAAARKPDGTSDIYAIIVETLNASSMRPCSTEFLTGLRELCDREGIVLIFDEVYTGWGKTGTLFNFMRVDGLLPDIVTYAKSFGGGKASISGYTARKNVAATAYDNLRDATLHSTTYYGFGEEVATAITAVNEIVNGGLLANSTSIGQQFGPEAMKLSERHRVVSDVRGSGALWGFILTSKIIEQTLKLMDSAGLLGRFSDPKIGQKVVLGSIINHLYEEHGVLTYFGSNVELPLIISFPLVATETEIDSAVHALDSTFDQNIVQLAFDFAKSKAKGPKAKHEA